MPQKIRDINRRGIERKLALRLAAALDPIHVILRALAEERRHRFAQFQEPPVAFLQLQAHLLVLGFLDQLAHGLAQTRNGQRHVVLHQVGPTNAQFAPGPRRAAAIALLLARHRFLQLLANAFDLGEKLVSLV